MSQAGTLRLASRAVCQISRSKRNISHMRLPYSIRWKLLRQSAYAAVRYNGNQRVKIEDGPAGVLLSVGPHSIHAPSPFRWKLYRWGWPARLDRLAREYGVGRHVTLSANSVILDIGANAGEFAHVAAQYNARIYCCEPDPALLACLKLNIAGLPKASVHDVAIWSETGELDFGLAPARTDSSVFADTDKRINVAAQTIDQFCQDNGIERIDLIKCDAEGGEPEVLAGIERMADRIGAIALDTGPERRGARTHEACAKRLSALGFHVIEEKIGTRWMTFGLRNT